MLKTDGNSQVSWILEFNFNWTFLLATFLNSNLNDHGILDLIYLEEWLQFQKKKINIYGISLDIFQISKVCKLDYRCKLFLSLISIKAGFKFRDQHNKFFVIVTSKLLLHFNFPHVRKIFIHIFIKYWYNYPCLWEWSMKVKIVPQDYIFLLSMEIKIKPG